jgi:excisionase family DNA binding protein
LKSLAFFAGHSLQGLAYILHIWCNQESPSNQEVNTVEQILTASQVAELLQVHLRTIYKLARRGLIPGRKFGGGWRFSKEEILKMISSGRLGSLETEVSAPNGDMK